MTGDTRNRILVASLVLFNEHGEPNTTTNEIADVVDISPGNLHYHFPRKVKIVDALLDEFQADARRVLEPPVAGTTTLDDFLVFLHQLLEFTAAYRFLFRDLESLADKYPRVRRMLGNFARGLRSLLEIYLHELRARRVLAINNADMPVVSRNLAVIALFSDRFDVLTGTPGSADDAALRVARSVLNVLKSRATDAAATHMDELAAHYDV